MNIDKKYFPLISALLELAGEEFSNHGYNDLDLTEVLPSVEDRRELMKQRHIFLYGNLEKFDPENSYEDVSDWVLMKFFSRLFEAASKEN